MKIEDPKSEFSLSQFVELDSFNINVYTQFYKVNNMHLTKMFFNNNNKKENELTLIEIPSFWLCSKNSHLHCKQERDIHFLNMNIQLPSMQFTL